MDGVTFVIGGSYPWAVSISPSGAHIAVARDVRLDLNKYHHRIDVDGVPGPEFNRIGWDLPTGSKGDDYWSEDGSTVAYVGLRQKPSSYERTPETAYLVHGAEMHGPFARGVRYRLSPDGRHLAAWIQPPGTPPTSRQHQLLLDGRIRQLPFVPEFGMGDGLMTWLDERWLVFDSATQEFVVQATPGQWRALDGRWIAAPPPDRPRMRVPLPEGIVVRTQQTTNTFRFGRHQILCRRRELWLNKRLLGEFDFILGGSSRSAYPQPDGSLIFYVARDNQLIRLRVKP